MRRLTLLIVLAHFATPSAVSGQAVVAEVQQSGGVSTDESSGSSTQLRVFGEPVRNLRFKVEGSLGQQWGEESDLLGTAYPYHGKAELIEAYAEYFFPERSFVRSVRGGRYRTPFGIYSSSEHGYIGFMRPPLIRYGEYWGLSTGYMEQGADVVVGTPHISAELSVGRPADVGEAIRRPGVDTVVRVEGSTDSMIVGYSFIDTTPFEPAEWAFGRARFNGIDARWMKGGVQLRGEYLRGQSLDDTTTDGGYLDMIAHRPAMGPLTLLARAEWLDYDVPGFRKFDLHTKRFQTGVRVRLWQGLSAAMGISHQRGQVTQYRPTALDVSFSYAVRTHP